MRTGEIAEHGGYENVMWQEGADSSESEKQEDDEPQSHAAAAGPASSVHFTIGGDV